MTAAVSLSLATSLEALRLADFEAVIERGLRRFVEVGEALREIRDGGLYRETHDSFEGYCRDRWGWSDRYARYLMEAAAVGTTVPVENEAQARELKPLWKEDRNAAVEAWEEVRSRWPDERPTAKRVQRVVAERLHRLRRERRAAGEAPCASDVPVGRGVVATERYVTPGARLEALVAEVETQLEICRVGPGSAAFNAALKVHAGRAWLQYVVVRGRDVEATMKATGESVRIWDYLPEADRFLADQPEVARVLREIDEALERERRDFLEDLSAWVGERSRSVGASVEPHIERLRQLADALRDAEPLGLHAGSRGGYSDEDARAYAEGRICPVYPAHRTTARRRPDGLWECDRGHVYSVEVDLDEPAVEEVPPAS